ncbi:hypothetical protein [Klebsiella quasipneumoniae]|uniref:hypothetical protein n=1 Tax=Klebsiella quasipneumoniae TaxID=1463165 RepID=UPI0037870582
MGEISVKTGNNARNGGKNSLNRLIRCVCGKKIGPDPRNFNQRVSLGRNDLLIRTFPRKMTDNEYERVLGAYLKPVSDLDNVSFKRKDNKTEIKGKDLLLTKAVDIETTQSGKLVEHQLLQEMSKFLVELSDAKATS